MTRTRRNGRIAMAAAAATALAIGLASVGSTAFAAPKPRPKVVEMICKKGWRGSGGGTYGGVGFSLACENGRSKTRLSGTDGNVYSIRMGVENQMGAIDCFFSGDAPNVNEKCGEVTIRIR